MLKGIVTSRSTAASIRLAVSLAVMLAARSPAAHQRPAGARLPAVAAAAGDARPACVQGEPPVFKVSVPGQAPVAGNRQGALVTIVEFMDFQCPFCGRAAGTMERLLDELGNDARLVFRHYPMPFHRGAMPAAQAAVAAGRQGRFWPMSRLLFENSRRLDEQLVFELAEQLQLDMDRFRTDFSSQETIATIEADIQEATRLGVRGTPTFFINGRQAGGARGLDYFLQMTRPLLAQARAAGGSGDALYRRLVACGYSERRPTTRQEERRAEPEKIEIRQVDIGDAPSLGPQQAPVVMVVFADFQCPYCARLNSTLQQLLEQYPDQVRLVFKHFPLPFHKQASLAHEAALAAGAQGKFWQMHDMIYANQRRLEQFDLEGYAGALGLDLGRFSGDLAHHTFAPAVERDLEQARQLGVKGTPTVYVNGRKLVGARSLEQYRQVIDKLLGGERP